jgi:hypothetical protein
VAVVNYPQTEAYGVTEYDISRVRTSEQAPIYELAMKAIRHPVPRAMQVSAESLRSRNKYHLVAPAATCSYYNMDQ